MTDTTIAKKSLWGWGMFALYGGFVLFILGIVVVCTMQDIHLVTPEYYEKELAYQGQIDKLNRTDALAVKPLISFDRLDRQIEIEYPNGLDLTSLAGSLTLFRPSNARYDQTFAVQADQFGRQYIAADKLMPGLWKVKIDWRVADEEYYSEDIVIVE